jgi:hypothetical protein
MTAEGNQHAHSRNGQPNPAENPSPASEFIGGHWDAWFAFAAVPFRIRTGPVLRNAYAVFRDSMIVFPSSGRVVRAGTAAKIFGGISTTSI